MRTEITGIAVGPIRKGQSCVFRHMPNQELPDIDVWASGKGGLLYDGVAQHDASAGEAVTLALHGKQEVTDGKGPLHPQNIRDACNELSHLLEKKQQDYGTRNIEDFGSMGVLVRANDKLQRLKTLTSGPDKPNFESLEDTWTDLAGYAILGLLMYRGEQDGRD